MTQSVVDRFVRNADGGLRDRILVLLYLYGAACAAVVVVRSFMAPLEQMDFAAVYWGSFFADPYAGLLPIGQFFLYPPTALPLSSALRSLPYLLALVLVQGVGLLLLYRSARVPLWMIFTPATILCVGVTQVGVLMSAFWILAFGGSALSGAFLTLKPNFGALYLVEAIRQRKAVRVTLVVLAWAALATILYGSHSWPDWIAQSQRFGQQFQSGALGLKYINASSTLVFGWWGWAVLAAFALWRCAVSWDLTTATLSAPLVAPYLLAYDLPAVCVVAVIELRRRHALPTQLALAATFLSPTMGDSWAGAVPACLAATLLSLAIERESASVEGAAEK